MSGTVTLAVIGGLTKDAAGHRIQLAIRERGVIFERREVRSVVAVAHDLLQLAGVRRWEGEEGVARHGLCPG